MTTSNSSINLDEFIETVKTAPVSDEVKQKIIGFIEEAKNDQSKADAVAELIKNFTSEDGKISDELWSLPTYAIEDFYNDFNGNGTEIAPDGTGVMDEPEED